MLFLVKITKNDITIEMPRVRSINVGGEEVSNEITMANGKKVKEMIGFRTVINAEWDWLPAEIIRDLHDLLRQGGYFEVEYPDPTGTLTGMFSISYPTSKIFKFYGDEPRWHNVTLTMRGQEVS